VKGSKRTAVGRLDQVTLLGHFFHSIGKDTGKVEWQGVVVGNPEPGWYLVQLFEWGMGEPNVRRLVRVEDMADWILYEDAETMKFSWEQGLAREGGKYRDCLMA
jgi:hypothetical protein